jgi:hypothetical protein
VRMGGTMCELKEFGGWRQRIFSFSAGLAVVRV